MPALNVNDAMQSAVQHHRAGQLAHAERVYRLILAAEPNHGDALHLLGVLTGQMGQTDTAIDLIRRAVSVRPNFPEAYTNLGRLLADKGRLEEAIAVYRRVVELRPTDAVAQNTL